MTWEEQYCRNDPFEVTKDHLVLLQRMFVSFEDDMYYGAPAIDIKKPYGNKCVYEDIAEMLGWTEKELTDEQIEKAKKLHEETATALQICLCSQKFEVGFYKKNCQYDARSWEKCEFNGSGK